MNEIKVICWTCLMMISQLFWTLKLHCRNFLQWKLLKMCSWSFVSPVCLRNLWDHQLKKLPFGFLSLRVGDITIRCWYTFVLDSLIMLIYVWYPWLDKDLNWNPLLLSRLTLSADFIQVGIGLLALQQLSGINGVLFYSSNIFNSAGQFSSLIICRNAYQNHQMI